MARQESKPPAVEDCSQPLYGNNAACLSTCHKGTATVKSPFGTPCRASVALYFLFFDKSFLRHHIIFFFKPKALS